LTEVKCALDVDVSDSVHYNLLQPTTFIFFPHVRTLSPPLAQVLAVKIMRKDKVHSVTDLKRVQNEIAVLRKVKHENIVTFIDVIFSPTNVYLFVEKGGEDLFEFFSAHLDGVDHSTAIEIIMGITLPIAYLHSLNICHRDLKPENVLLKIEEGRPIQSGMIQICDFGLCQKVKPGATKLSEFCGSPGFFAPEMILGGAKYNGLLVDVWSIGCIMLELTLGHENFCKKWMSAYDFEIIQRPGVFEDSIEYAVSNLQLDGMTDVMQEFIKDILVIDPDLRKTSEDLLHSMWFEGHPSLPINDDKPPPRRVHLDSMDVQATERLMNDIGSGDTSPLPSDVPKTREEFKALDAKEPDSPNFLLIDPQADGEAEAKSSSPSIMREVSPVSDIKATMSSLAGSTGNSSNDLHRLALAKTRIQDDSEMLSCNGKM